MAKKEQLVMKSMEMSVVENKEVHAFSVEAQIEDVQAAMRMSLDELKVSAIQMACIVRHIFAARRGDRESIAWLGDFWTQECYDRLKADTGKAGVSAKDLMMELEEENGKGLQEKLEKVANRMKKVQVKKAKKAVKKKVK